MNCYECGLRGETVPAVATCKHCGVGLCTEHLAEAQRYRVGGTLWGCPHDLSAAATAPRATKRVARDGRVGELAGTPR